MNQKAEDLCAKCGLPTPVDELNADDQCSTCAHLAKLRETLEERGVLHPDLFEHNQLPPSDR